MAESELGIIPGFDSRETALLEPRDLGLRERLVGEVAEWRSPPELERGGQELRCSRGIPGL